MPRADDSGDEPDGDVCEQSILEVISAEDGLCKAAAGEMRQIATPEGRTSGHVVTRAFDFADHHRTAGYPGPPFSCDQPR